MDSAQLQEGIAYAEVNYLSKDGFSKLDKEFITANFDLKGKDVLDFGCGMGHMSVWFANELGAKVYGVDIDDNHIAVSKEFIKKYPAKDVVFDLRNIITDPVDKQFDFIFLNDVIEHIRDEWIEGVLDILVMRNLKPGGYIFFSYPPWEGPHASHLQPVTKLPWVQYLPKSYVLGLIKKRNFQLVGKHDMMAEYLELNHMTHKKLSRFLRKYQLKNTYRKSHTKFNKIGFLKDVNLNFFPFKFVVTKELVAFQKPLS